MKEGGPEKLEDPCNEERALFLCYPDEFEGDEEDEEEDDDGLGLRCLHAFEGDVVSRSTLRVMIAGERTCLTLVLFNLSRVFCATW